MGILDKLFPSEEQKHQLQVEELKKEIAALTDRHNALLKETQKVKEDYEQAVEEGGVL